LSLRSNLALLSQRPGARRGADALVALLLFVALTWARTAGISENFWLLGEQIRDWAIAIGPWHDLPLAGTPSTVGGRSLGPVYYWLLWVIRVTVGPFYDYLPHAGAIGLSLVQSAADVVLFVVLRRQLQSLVLALAVVLLVSTGPYDLALSAIIWNPPLSVALVKFGLAAFLVSANHPSRLRMSVTVIVLWLAVQAHSSALFVFAPLTAWFIARDLANRRWSTAAQCARLILEIVLVLQIPFLIDRLTSSGAGGAPAMVLESAARMTDPGALRLGSSLEAMRGALNYAWGFPTLSMLVPAALLVGALAAAYAARHRPWLLFATVLPLAAIVAGFSTWQRPFEAYWYLTVAPSAALTIALAPAAIGHQRARALAATLLLGAVLAHIPGRVTQAHALLRLPEYGPLIRGTQEIARRTPEIRDIFTEFTLPPSTDATFPFVCMGGRVTTTAEYNAFIAADGTVTFRPTRQP
jgi:hypothetical protein